MKSVRSRDLQQTCPDQWVRDYVVRGDKKGPGSRNPAYPQHERALLQTLVPRRQQHVL